MNKILMILMVCIFSLLNASDDFYDDMNLEELVEMEIVETATKMPEELFVTPLTVTIIKQKQIQNSCASTIPEVLRLAPGVIVREITPGNFDVHIRGFDDATKNFIYPLPVNSTTLVMIDGRIVFDYFSGGTFWESLPVTLNEIQRIEVVSGPAAALYGPNALLGVINIITFKHDDMKCSKTGTFSLSNENDKRINTSLVFNLKNNFRVLTTINLMQKKRRDSKYYDGFIDEYVDYDFFHHKLEMNYFDNFSFENSERPDEDLSVDKVGFTSSLIWNPHYFKNMNLSFGFQKTDSQKFMFQNFVTPFSTFENEHLFVDFTAKWYNTKLKTYLQSGQRECNYWWLGYSYIISNFSLEHDFKTRFGRFVPGFNFMNAEYSNQLVFDHHFNDLEVPENESRSISAFSPYILADFNLTNKLRLIIGSRIESYENHSQTSKNGQFALTYRVNSNNFLRLVVATASRSQFILESYYDSYHKFAVDFNNDDEIDNYFSIEGNQNNEFLKNHSFELGWRFQSHKNSWLDIEFFSSYLEDFSDIIRNDDNQESGPVNAIMSIGDREDFYAIQYGIGITYDIKFNKKIDLNLYGSFHTTEYSFNEDDPQEAVGISTPESVFGANVVYAVSEKLILSSNFYSMEEQTFESPSVQGNGEYKIKEVLPEITNLDAKIQYKINNRYKLFFSGKNLLGKHKEFGFADNVYTTFEMGLNFNL